MKNFIVTTTINPPTEALIKYADLKDWHMIVVGDQRTPPGYEALDCTYLSTDAQEKIAPELSELIGWNSIQRRNIGFLHALSLGAEVIATVDDDNIPLDNWGKDLRIGVETEATEFGANSDGWFDPISVSGYPHLWHRGFPIQFLANRRFPNLGSNRIVPSVQASFWNGDPDVDAICRMEHQPDCNFDDSNFPFFSKGMAPFNSQNTFLTREATKEYFMFPHIGRMDDIWASLYMVSKGFDVLYARASVFQDRNNHDLTRDFTGEIIGYENTYKLGAALRDNPNSIESFLPAKSWAAFMEYKKLAATLD
jgi:hypothetical protein